MYNEVSNVEDMQDMRVAGRLGRRYHSEQLSSPLSGGFLE